MISSPKRHKGVKFNKVQKQNFKHAKRLSINKSPNKLNFLNEEYSPHIKGKKRNSIKNIHMNDLLKNIEDNYSLTKKHSNKGIKKIRSSNKIIKIKFKDLILPKKTGLKKENEKNEEDDDLPMCLNLEHKNIQQKRYTSTNNIHHIFKSIINKDMINKYHNISKKNSKGFNTIDVDKETNCNYNNNNSIKKKKKKKENKINIIKKKSIIENLQNKCKKEKNENNNEITDKEKNDNNSKIKDKEKNKNKINNIKSKFFCCL